MSRLSGDCRRCAQARRLASFCFAAFAFALMVSAMDPALDSAQKGMLLMCGIMAALAFFRHRVARLFEGMARGLGRRGPQP